MTMKAKIILAEAATSHPDGTTSMLRAGITHLWGESPPLTLQAALYVRIEAELGDEGSHQFDLRCMNEDGVEVLPRLQGQFQVSRGGGVNSIVLGVAMAFQKFGPFTFYLRVDNVELDKWTITAAKPQKEGRQ